MLTRKVGERSVSFEFLGNLHIFSAFTKFILYVLILSPLVLELRFLSCGNAAKLNSEAVQFSAKSKKRWAQRLYCYGITVPESEAPIWKIFSHKKLNTNTNEWVRLPIPFLFSPDPTLQVNLPVAAPTRICCPNWVIHVIRPRCPTQSHKDISGKRRNKSNPKVRRWAKEW